MDVRIHLFFLLLLGLSVSYGSAVSANGGRGLALWLMLVLAVGVREAARALGAAWFGLKLRSIVLLPTGGMITYATSDATERSAAPEMQRKMGLIGPIANVLFGLVVAAIVVTVTPQVNLIERPWVTPAHLLRALIWVNLLLGVVNLLPAVPLDGGRVFRGEFMRTQGGLKGIRVAAAVGQMTAFALMLGGLFFSNIWMTMIGAFVLIGAHMDDQGLLLQSDNDSVKMRDVMMTAYSTLSASDTLEDALERSIHTLQDVFPVVRGASMVGAVSRQSIVEALQADGNGYIQGVMTKSFQTAHPDDSLVKTLKRVMAGRGAQLLPVMEGERVVGIITPQNLAHSMGMLSQSRKSRGSE